MATEQQYTKPRKFGIANVILILGLGALLCGEVYFGYKLHTLSATQEQIKEDYSLANNITFGLFSVDIWRERISDVINHQVKDFKLTSAQKKQMRQQVDQQLHSLVHKTVAEINQPQKSIGGKLKKIAFNAMVSEDQLQAQVPGFSKTIIDKVSSPKSVTRLKNIATSKITQLENQTYDSTQIAIAAITKHMYAKYHVANPVAFVKEINKQLADIRAVTYRYAYAMLGCVALALALWLLMRKMVHLQSTLFVMSLLFAFVLLVVGITTTIIEVDARLSTLNFTMMGQKVAFENQELFFQSKSIMNVVQVLIGQPKPDAVTIGVLILVFVVCLPLIRLIARGIHILTTEKFAKNKVLHYLAFESGKWDMSDVMVVGILMTYIGLNGILKSQLSNMNIHNAFLNTETVNDSTLQPGYFIFVGYVVFATILSYVLKKITPHKVSH